MTDPLAMPSPDAPDAPDAPVALKAGRATIVVVEDEMALAEAIQARLLSEGYSVALAHDGPGAVAMVEATSPDLVVLDLMLPGFDGLEVCRRIQLARRVPVIMLTARDSETDLVVGLAVGADDYIAKPFSPRELVARIQALLRRARPADDEVPDPMLRFGRLEIDAAARTATRDGVAIHLTATEFDLLGWFLKHPGRVFTREQLLRTVWGYADGSGARTVDSHVQAVRRKAGAHVVRTVHGIGYSLGAATPDNTTPSGNP